jgi:glucosylceramidase
MIRKSNELFFWTVSILFLTLSCRQAVKITITTTTPDEQWNSQMLSVKAIQDSDQPVDLVLDTLSAGQTILGFGGCFNELGWEALQSLNMEEQRNILAALFDTLSGCCFSMCRMPIGANDYAVDWYSHNEVPDDYGMDSFSIRRDELRLIPYINRAQEFNPGLKIWASPWCPPSWMKTNHHYACRADSQFNDLPVDRQGEEMITQFRMEEKVLNAYALYFRKFIDAYAEKDIIISAIHPQNELNSCQVFPSCIWRPEDMARFIGDFLGPKLSGLAEPVSIFLGTIERPQMDRIDPILQHPEAGKYISGAGFQWAGKGAIAAVHEKYPGLILLQTETECGDGSNDWKAAEHTWELMKHYFNAGANGYMYWNMVLDETGQSQWGWKQNSMITINRTSGKITYNPEFYLMKHLTHYVKPGAFFIHSKSEQSLVFSDKDNYILLVYNELDDSKVFSVKVNSHIYPVELPAKSFATLIINKI